MSAHRAGRPSHAPRSETPTNSAPVTTGVGRHRAPPAGKARGRRWPSVPSIPLIVGTVVLTTSTGAAIVTSDVGPTGVEKVTSTRTSLRSAAFAASSQVGLAERRAVVSRGQGREDFTAPTTNGLVMAAERQARSRAAALARLADLAASRSAELELDLWYRPVSVVELTARFGEYGLWADSHTGLDFNGDTGDPIYAVAGGVVTSAGYDGAYGYKTVITAADGTEIWFAHQSDILVDEGQLVRGGEQIGTIGATGNVTGSHLHLEIRPGGGDPVDPYPVLLARGLL